MLNFYNYFLQSSFFRHVADRCFSKSTKKAISWDTLRLRARIKSHPLKLLSPASPYLHFGCGDRIVDGWLNVDIANSDFDIDLASAKLPWKDDVFQAAVGQQIIEHLDIHEEFIPLLVELRRVLAPNGELWLSCPHIEKICRSYLDHRMADLMQGRKVRFPNWSLGDIPSSEMINHFFHQSGEHKNLFDFELLRWVLEKAGFSKICEIQKEGTLLARFPEFPHRGDDDHALYVKAIK